jgi:hypothetical protein
MGLIYLNLLLIPFTAFLAGALTDNLSRYVNLFATAVNVGVVFAALLRL